MITETQIQAEMATIITDAMIDRELAIDPTIPVTCMCCRQVARRKIVERIEDDRRTGDRRAW